MRWFAPLAICLVALGCHHGTDATSATSPDGGATGDALPEVHVIPDAGHYVFSWYAADGKIHDTDAVKAIPESERKQVFVRDLARTSVQLQSDRYLYLADMSRAAPDDGYPTSVVSRYSFESQDNSNLPALGTDSELEDADGGTRPLAIIYGTSWCGACKAAREHFKQRHVPFADKDIEKDPGAAAELERKAKRAGLHLGGVPVLDIAGHMMMGFDAATVDKLVAEATKS
jgi:glutaredoxin